VRQAQAAYANGYAGDSITIALDRSVRRTDVDGRLHIELTNLSKANVCPYYGREIPGAAAFGLDPNKIYQLYRDADELAKAAPTFNNVPLLDEHIIVTAGKPEKGSVVGSTGTDAEFDGEYLRNSLVIWDAEAIARIESGEQKQLSCAYRYVVDMRPGTHNGLTFDGRMTNIQANHVALVKEGRAGPDVVVADGVLGDRQMRTSKKALMVRGAVSAYLAPLALDAKPDLSKALAGVTAKTLPTLKVAIAKRIATDAKLTPDQAAGLAMALDAAEAEEVDGEDEAEEETEEEKADPLKKEAADKRAKDKAARDKRAKDEAEEDTEEERKEREAKDAKTMDAAIAAAVNKAVADTTARLDGIAKAKDAVAPYIGAVAGMDSADGIYKLALDAAGVDTKDVDPSAFPALLKLIPLPGSAAPRVAMDSKARGDVIDMFPQLARISRS